MPGRPMSSRTTCGANTGADASASWPSATALTSWPASSSSTAIACAASLVVVDHEDAACELRGGRLRSRRGRRTLRDFGEAWQRHPELRSAAGAGARHLDLAVVHLDQAANERQADAQAALAAVERALALREQLEDIAAAARASMPMPLSRHRDLGFAGRASPRATMSITPPSSVYLAALFSRLAITCARRAKSPRSITGTVGQLLVIWCRRSFDERHARSRRACSTTARRSSDSTCERDLALVDARHVEQVVDEPRQLVDLALGDVHGPGQLGLVRRDLADHLDRVADRRQRVAQLVREHREELVLAPVRARSCAAISRRTSISTWRLRYRRAFSSAIAARAASSSTISWSPAEVHKASAPTARRDEIKGTSNGPDAPPAAGAAAPASVLRHDSASSCPSADAARWTMRSAPRGRACAVEHVRAGSPDSSQSATDARRPKSGTSNSQKLARGGVGIERCAEPLARLRQEVRALVFASAAERAACSRRARPARRPGGAACAAPGAGRRTP